MTRGVAVVTGASAGIGRAASAEFARSGWNVALIAREPERLVAARAEVESAGARAVAVVADVADAGQVEAAAERAERELGPIDVWVNNAMVTVFAPFEAMTADEYERVTQVTYLGAVNGTRAALKRMKPRDRGCILQVGSALAFRSIPLQSAYCGAKAGLRGFTDALRSELIHDRSGVRVTMLQLSAFNTPQFNWARSRMPRRVQPVPPIFQPEIAARAIVWAATHRRRDVWVGWPAIKAILSSRLFASLGDRRAAERAWEGQETPEPDDSLRDNLFAPVPGPFGAHGRFDRRARQAMPALWVVQHRVAVGSALVAAAFILILLGVP